MSDFLWIMCTLDDEQYDAIEQSFNQIIKPKEPTQKHRDLISISKSKPDALLPRYIPVTELPSHMDSKLFSNGFIDNKMKIDFESIFTIDDIDKLFYSLPMNENNVIEFSGYESPPFAVLAYSIDVDSATSLPGLYGNMLIKHSQLAETIEKTEKILSKIDNKCRERARRYISSCSAGNITYQYDDEIQKLFTILPLALKTAVKRKSNFIALTLWMG